MNKNKFAVIGAGGWGTALAIQLSKKHDVIIWAYEEAISEEINSQHTNNLFLPKITLPTNIRATSRLHDISECEYIINTVPTQHIRGVYKNISNEIINNSKVIINGAKGIERQTLMRISEIFSEVCGISLENYVVLTGPSHAEEVSRNIPTTIVAASNNLELAKQTQEIFSNESLRVYSSDDVIGCELGGALKNIIAVTAGMLDGLLLGDNTKAALITRGLAEMTRLGVALGANPLTFAGLSGLGDLVVTCNSLHSRNRKVGELLAQGWDLEKIIQTHKTVAEGVTTTESALQLSRKVNVEMPITEQTFKALFEKHPVKEIITSLMSREYRNEIW